MKKKPTKTNKKVLKPKQKQFIEAYIKNLSNVSKACEVVDINRATYYDWLSNPLFNQSLNDANQLFNDGVEQRILKHAMDMDKEMLKFWARHKMRERGFIDRQEIEHKGDERIQIIINKDEGPSTINQETK